MNRHEFCGVHLGFEVGTGKPVEIPLRHMVVTGQTQEAGKTTTLEALIARANLPAVAFVTKRGEKSFSAGRRLAPYFRERADWQFVSSVLEATMREKLKFERAWIIRASKGARTLADVHRNVLSLMEKAKGLSADVYLTLNEYLEIVVPRIAAVRFATSLTLLPGLNVLDLSKRDQFPPELQALVMRSVIEWIYEHADGAVTIIPEAWEFLPQGRGSPVKLAAVELIRKGAGLRNYVWLDSQDIGGVDKEVLRSCPVWLLGVQREANEIERVLKNIPAGVAKPRPGDVARLQKGQFYACYGEHVIKTYVQPAWMTEKDAITVACSKGGFITFSGTPDRRGRIKVDVPRETGALATMIESNGKKMAAAVRPWAEQVGTVKKQKSLSTEDDDLMSSEALKKLDRITELLEQALENRALPAGAGLSTDGGATRIATSRSGQLDSPGTLDEETLYQRFKARLTKEAPSILKVLVTKPELRIEEVTEIIEVDIKTARGMVAKLIQEGFVDDIVSANVIHKELKRRWDYRSSSVRIYEQCAALTSMGFLTKEEGGYRAQVDMKRNIVKG
jgi:predicted transcriptional regulator